MSYKEVTEKILDQIRNASEHLSILQRFNEQIKQKANLADQLVSSAGLIINLWTQQCVNLLEENDLLIEKEKFLNYIPNAISITDFKKELSNLHLYLTDRKKLLIEIAQKIESTKSGKELVILKIDEIDNFQIINRVDFTKVQEFSKSAFLEDDVEEAFLGVLGEPYKEQDSGAETRDLFTDKIKVNGKRLSTAIMFKGRAVKGALSIDECGAKGNQLLKLAKNNAAECFIVQHVNKIEQDVREALADHVLMNTRLNKVYVCFIDGTDTARFLKSIGEDLDKLKNKKSTKKSTKK